MNEKELEEKLREEGFSYVYIWEDRPNAFYPDHTHPRITAHIILKGEMTVTSEGKTQTYKEGQRFDVPAETVHSAQIGPLGCRYIIGEK
ncbi:MAG TPA: cupin domain-containing protein [Thermodesulfobacteriota bacterium]|nr:cupin domain-containing protein [Thermodesulfobacteriota bacterium]